MSDNLTEKEIQLCNTIRQHFQVNGGVYDEIKCQLQNRLVEMMRGTGQNDKKSGSEIQRDARIVLLNQLIMEYLHWHRLNYTAEMLSMETQMDKDCIPNRELLEAAVGKFEEKSVPILIEIVSNLWQKQKQKEINEPNLSEQIG